MKQTAPKYFWTYTGYKGDKAYLLAHETLDSAEYHHGMAQSLGGAFDTIGMTRRAVDETEARAGLAARFACVEIVNPVKAQTV